MNNAKIWQRIDQGKEGKRKKTEIGLKLSKMKLKLIIRPPSLFGFRTVKSEKGELFDDSARK